MMSNNSIENEYSYKHTHNIMTPKLLVGEFKNLEDTIICSICLNILHKPVSCQQCSTAFCYECIDSWKSNKQNKCPFCNCQLGLENINRLAMNFLSKIQLLCYNKNCNVSVSYDSFYQHYNNCDLTETTCKHCNKDYEKRDILNHIKECPIKIVACQICGIKLKRQNYIAHFDIAHPPIIQSFKCDNCNVKFDSEIHLKKHTELCLENIRLKNKLNELNRIDSHFLDELNNKNMIIEKLKAENYLLMNKVSEIEPLNSELRLLKYKNETLQNEFLDYKKRVKK